MQSESFYSLVDYPTRNEEYGKYKGKSPLSAAKKIFTKLEKNMSLNNSNLEKQYIEFTIRNLQTNKFYTYIGTKVLLHSPITINYNGRSKTINYKHLVNRRPKHLDTLSLNKLMNTYTNHYNKYNNNSN